MTNTSPKVEIKTTTVLVQKRREASMYWKLAAGIRNKTMPIEEVEQKIALYFNNLSMSDWFFDRLKELLILNRERNVS